ncbi:class I SAM-dependent methyltransferase [Xanthomarina sp. F1114]|uniref:THUMP-like domain-containing protein n=1 Tax=Xanthomarina sp. F1114 TaxID=2996019 RepID=UPI00225E22D4|nr:class I SAM-dependent methyltransferase [Xanthomarina sp. F1114]MCX7548027.1 class I SAM-dependent methyltransferase [Xanthomarina sp. F1114]
MNKGILNTVNQDFINKHIDTDIAFLLLRSHSELEIDIKLLLEQIEAKKRSKKKLSSWFQTKNIYYPNKLNIEQTSSEVTAEYKSKIISGNSIIDLTGGFGVDCFYFAKQFRKVTHCEINTQLSEIVKHNYQQLKTLNIQTVAADGISYLKKVNSKFDWIYIDPSRRHDSKGKVFFLKDCLPNVPEHLDLLFSYSENILIKTSPLLDLSVGIIELKHVKSIHIVAVNNEVKELLWILEKDINTQKINIETVNIKDNHKEFFRFNFYKENSAKVQYSLPLTYLYEPNSAILKSGGFNSVSEQLKAKKLRQHSHLYTSNEIIAFPGRAFKIDKILSYNKKQFRKSGITKANITTRNFPDSVENIRKKLGVKNGGDIYIFATTNLEGQKLLIICSKFS